jgi:hypothetical protein
MIRRFMVIVSERFASVRIIDSVTSGKYQYPNGYVVYMNSSRQTIKYARGPEVTLKI